MRYQLCLQNQISERSIAVIPRSPSVPFFYQSPQPLVQVTADLHSHYRLVLPVQEIYIKGIIQYVVYHVWPLTQRDSEIHPYFARISNLFCFIAE